MKRSIDVANVLLQNSSSEVLLLQRATRLAHPHIWGLPGGMIDKGEADLLAGIRELEEETGIVEGDITIAGIKRFLVQTPSEDIRITNIHAVSSRQELPIVLSPDEHIAYKWMSESDIYGASDLLPGSPTMIAAALHDNNLNIIDLTVSDGIYIIPLA